MKDQLPSSWTLLQAHHRAREGLYRRIIDDCRLAPAARILDAACGDAFYAGLLAAVVGPEARIVAADINLASLRASTLPRDVAPRCLTDVERAGFPPRSFEVVWMCRSMHSALDPQRRVDGLVELLRPSGRLIVIEDELTAGPRGGWPLGLDQIVRRALHSVALHRCRDGTPIERYQASHHLAGWLERAGLQHVTTVTYPVADGPPWAPDVEAYWATWLRWCGDLIRPFLSPADRAAFGRATDPESPAYVLRQPGVVCDDAVTVVSGAVP